LPGAADPPLPGAGGRRLSGVRPRPLVLALLHEGELIDEVPAEPHDRPVHGVITPTGTFSLSRAFEWTK
jgi:5-formyltetrahydrofolate cyclo-ligase